MEKTLGCGLWVATALYVAVGVFSVVFHNALPDVRQLTDGYRRQKRCNGVVTVRELG